MRNNPYRVIVRSWGDEPVEMLVHTVGNKYATVDRDGSKKTIGIPLEQIYEFDGAKFSTALRAFKAGKFEELVKVYDNLDDFSCNKYQDSLRSQHDKENVTDSESTASGGQQ